MTLTGKEVMAYLERLGKERAPCKAYIIPEATEYNSSFL